MQVYILWDESHIWGLLAVRAVQAMQLPYRLVRGQEIAAGLLDSAPPALFLVPGGNARWKAESLGQAGVDSIRLYVRNGGQYLGFCGGAGLALSWEDDRAAHVTGLGLCPWKRAGFDDRMQHFMSGHLHVRIPQPASKAPKHSLLPNNFPQSPSLPVWWPGRFEQDTATDVTVLAVYEKPAEDFWLADLPIASLPAGTFSTWQDVYGFSAHPTFLEGQPCVIHGSYGKGSYTLSYSHLETPASPDANTWLAHIFRTQAGMEPTTDAIPCWRLQDAPSVWEDPTLHQMHALLQKVLQTGLQHGLLFTRNDWLMGWRTGIPGSNLNNLWAALQSICSQEPTPAAQAYWSQHKNVMLEAMQLFSQGCVQYLMAERLAMTLAKSLPEVIPPAHLRAQRSALFGPPMRADGLYHALMQPLDDLAFLQIND